MADDASTPYSRHMSEPPVPPVPQGPREQRSTTADDTSSPAPASLLWPVPHTSSWTGVDIAELVAGGVLDVVPGDPPVPISVWRATGPHEPPTTPSTLFRGLTHRIAAILVALYTDVDDLVLDTTADPVLAGAAGAGGRRYRPWSPGSGAAPGIAHLILLRWPGSSRPPQARTVAGARSRGSVPVGPATTRGEDLLRACTQVLTSGGHTVAILAPPLAGTYRDHARALIAAAKLAGLGYLQHIVAITGTAPARQDPPAISSGAGSDPAATAGREATHAVRFSDGLQEGAPRAASDAGAHQDHLDLLVFILRSGPPAQPH